LLIRLVRSSSPIVQVADPATTLDPVPFQGCPAISFPRVAARAARARAGRPCGGRLWDHPRGAVRSCSWRRSEPARRRTRGPQPPPTSTSPSRGLESLVPPLRGVLADLAGRRSECSGACGRLFREHRRNPYDVDLLIAVKYRDLALEDVHWPRPARLGQFSTTTRQGVAATVAATPAPMIVFV
jgi:hypothetical protein